MKSFISSVLLLGCLCMQTHAGEQSFPKENFRIVLPDHWEKLAVPPEADSSHTHMVLAARGSDGDRELIVVVSDRETKTPADIDAFSGGIGKPYAAKGWTVSPLREEVIHNIPFTIFTVTKSTDKQPFTFLASTFTGKNVFSISGFKKSGDPSTDEELRSVLESFRFLNPVKSVSRK